MLPNVSWKNMVCVVLVKHQRKTCLRALQAMYGVNEVRRFIEQHQSNFTLEKTELTQAMVALYSTIRFVRDYKFIFTFICGRS